MRRPEPRPPKARRTTGESTRDTGDEDAMADHRAGDARTVSVEPERAPRLPPRWFVRAAWVTHRAIYSVTAAGGAFGVRPPTAGA